MRLFKLLTVLFLLLASVFDTCAFASSGNSAKIYYLNAIDGDDQNCGTSQSEAFKSIARINEVKLSAGDKVLFHRSQSFVGELEVSACGDGQNPIIIDAYGSGRKPIIEARNNMLYAVKIENCNYVTLQNLEVVNCGSQELAKRSGVIVSVDNFGVCEGVVIRAIDVRDVNGSRVKAQGGGAGMSFIVKGDSIPSKFNNLLVEQNSVRRCQRNGFGWKASKACASTNVIFRYNLIEEVPGDGIVPLGCDGAIIEYNLMRHCPATLPSTEAAAGIWPWDCDNTIIRFNEVSDHKAPWDAQGFDSDYLCENTIIEYNYSHDNWGGFLLVCSPKISHWNSGNNGSLIQYNLSVGDAIRPVETRQGILSPTIHITGPVTNTVVCRNILHVNPKPENPAFPIDRTLIRFDAWDNYPIDTHVKENLFYMAQSSQIIGVDKSRNTEFSNNYYLGECQNNIEEESATKAKVLKYYQKLLAGDPLAYDSLVMLLTKEMVIADGQATLRYIDKSKIEAFFSAIDKKNK